MYGNDPGLFVVPGDIARQLEDLCSQVLHDGGEVDRGSGSHTLGGVSLAEQPVNTSHWELKTCSAGPGLGLHLGLASFATDIFFS